MIMFLLTISKLFLRLLLVSLFVKHECDKVKEVQDWGSANEEK